MRKAGRKILLFIDSATSHSQSTKLAHQSRFFPSNSSITIFRSRCNWKLQTLVYRFVSTHILSMASSCKNSDELANIVNVLNAVQWMRSATKSVSQDCVKKCFEKAGFVVTVPIKRNLNLIEESEDLSQLIKDNGNNVTAEEYMLIDEELQTRRF